MRHISRYIYLQKCMTHCHLFVIMAWRLKYEYVLNGVTNNTHEFNLKEEQMTMLVEKKQRIRKQNWKRSKVGSPVQSTISTMFSPQLHSPTTIPAMTNFGTLRVFFFVHSFLAVLGMSTRESHSPWETVLNVYLSEPRVADLSLSKGKS